MHELTGKIVGVSFDYLTGKPIVSFELDEGSQARAMVDDLRQQERLSLKVGKFKQKRSLDANAYFHLLVNKIARAVNKSDDEVKQEMVMSYGTLARDENGDLIGAMLPVGANVERFYPYARNYKTEYREGREYNCYLFYERTRDLDRHQFSKLLEGTVQEAKNLGIETRPQWEIDSLLENWRN